MEAATPGDKSPGRRQRTGKRIVLATFGSYGDLHPYMALALGLQDRGHTAVLATSSIYRQKIEAAGIGFHPMRPEFADFGDIRETIRRVMDPKKGPEYVVRSVVLPALRDSFADLSAAVEGADLLVTHPLTYAGPIIAEKEGLTWVSTALQPLVFFSACDPPFLGQSPLLSKLVRRNTGFARALIRLGKWSTRSWMTPIEDLRKELGLPSGENPLFEGQYSPYLNLAMFSSQLAEAQRDWPANTLVTGFCFYDRESDKPVPPDIMEFLKEGSAPLIFTLGSSAVLDAGQFYEESAKAAKLLGRRALLLTGRDGANQLAETLPKGVIACDYAPYSDVFPYAAVIIHQGGVGTTGQAMRAGRPMLIMPYSQDQPDNAARIARLGIGRVIARKNYSAEHAAREIRPLLKDMRYAQNAGTIGWEVQAEDGVKAACDAIERLLFVG